MDCEIILCEYFRKDNRFYNYWFSMSGPATAMIFRQIPQNWLSLHLNLFYYSALAPSQGWESASYRRMANGPGIVGCRAIWGWQTWHDGTVCPDRFRCSPRWSYSALISLEFSNVSARQPIPGHKHQDIINFLKVYHNQVVLKWLQFYVYKQKIQSEKITKKVKPWIPL